MTRFSNEYGFWELNSFPGCNQISVSNHSFIYPEYRGKGYGTRSHNARLAQAAQLGYDVVVCTCHYDNAPQMNILRRAKWKLAFMFRSSETDKEICFWFKILNKNNKKKKDNNGRIMCGKTPALVRNK